MRFVIITIPIIVVVIVILINYYSCCSFFLYLHTSYCHYQDYSFCLLHVCFVLNISTDVYDIFLFETMDRLKAQQ